MTSDYWRTPLGGGATFSWSHRAGRGLWRLAWGFGASWTPRQFAPWRRMLLRLFGARIAATADVRGGARIWLPANLVMEDHAVMADGVDCYNIAPVMLGRGALVSQGARLITGTHDIDDPDFSLEARPIVVGADAWIASGAVVGPGVRIGRGAVLGAHAVAFSDLAEWTVHIGNPARLLRQRRRREDEDGR